MEKRVYNECGEEELSNHFISQIKKGSKDFMIWLIEKDFNFSINKNDDDVLIKVHSICTVEFYKNDISIFKVE